MAVGTNWGIVGVSCGLVGASAVALVINFHRSLPLLGSSLREMFHALAPSMFSGLVMYGAVLATKAYLLAGTTSLRAGPLQRCFRDIHAASQHFFAGPASTLEFGRGLMENAAGDALEA